MMTSVEDLAYYAAGHLETGGDADDGGVNQAGDGRAGVGCQGVCVVYWVDETGHGLAGDYCDSPGDLWLEASRPG